MDFNTENASSILINKIKQKPELNSVNDKFIQESLENYLKKKNLSLESLKNFREKEIKIIVKDIRAQLRLITGQFSKISEKERASNYTKVKEIMDSLNIKSILDLGCGLNPIFLASENREYYALDINNSFIERINSFFSEKKIKGNAFFFDLKKISPLILPKADICLILKVFDVIEKRGHKLAEKIINSINSRYFLISFPTKTLSGMPMRHPQRGWIEHLLSRLGFSFKFYKTKDEIFYLAKKDNIKKTILFKEKQLSF